MPLRNFFRLTAAAAIGLTMTASAAFSQTAQPTTEELEKFGPMIRAYLLQNPEIVIEAITLYQQQEEAAQARAAARALQDSKPALFNSSSPVIGNPDGDIVIVEFFDYRCGYCKSVVDGLFGAVASDSNVKLIMKEFPILGPESTVAARAALASRKQGKYDVLHRALMSHRGQLNESAIYRIAEQTGMDINRLKLDMTSPEVDAELAQNSQLAQRLGIRGTPAFIVGDEIIPGAVPMQQLLEQAKAAREG